MENINTIVVRSKVVMCCILLLGALLFIGATSISDSYHKKMALEVEHRKQWSDTVTDSLSISSSEKLKEWTKFAEKNPQLMLKATTDYYLHQ